MFFQIEMQQKEAQWGETTECEKRHNAIVSSYNDPSSIILNNRENAHFFL